ncbi:hypothetical protein K458DRAFT_400070 [Lentithecium fluviatile CBS 122367]|uniref:Uncharacterized protein n=1 Tax=Lentithecium fluviatile CBS 122367 TaxID=1168545 RepID=A0A6G1JGD2_9PLEO|nr:hypothetical protein K458DRAFT_400070 [Lentithecium fluviatile CBS 122367]
MEAYTDRRLTVFEDRPPALSGMATQEGPLRTNRYMGPSWSWITHERVNYWKFTPTSDRSWGLCRFRSESKSIDAWYLPEDQELNPFGQIVDVGIQVEGKVAKPNRQVADRQTNIRRWSGIYLSFGNGAISECTIDWDVENRLEEKVVRRMSLLLLASVIGYYRLVDSDEEFGEAFEQESDEAGSVAIDEVGEEKVDHDQIDREEGSWKTCDEETEMSGLAAPNPSVPHMVYPKTAYADSKHQENDGTQNRDAWGLLLFAKVGIDKFVRVGMIRYKQGDGGLRAFDSYEFRHLEIV